MLLLALETSCDETAAALLKVESALNITVLAEQISSQAHIHEAYGGVVPELASREHMRNLPYVIESVLERGAVSMRDITVVGVTRGPGLAGCLLVGVAYAKGLSAALGIPLVGVNHIEGHLLSCNLETKALPRPFLALVVSGGHTEIIEVKDLGRYFVHTRTTDDAAGEAFDKSAHLLGLSYPGGAALAALADKCRGSRFKLPRVMREAPGFSFSGLKTAISLMIKEQSCGRSLAEELKAEMAYAIQEAIVDSLVFKLRKVISDTGIRSVCLVGGVSANRALRAAVEKIAGVAMFVPEPIHCTDNAAMIGYAAALRYLRGERMNMSESAISRWPVEKLSP